MSLISGMENFCALEDYVTLFCRFFCLAVPKTLKGNRPVLCFGNFPEAKKFVDEKGGVSKISAENILSHSAEKNRRGTL